MRATRLQPTDLRRGSLYFTSADPRAQLVHRISDESLEMRMRLLCLLSDKVVVASSHIFESRRTFEILKRNHNLLQEGIVVPALSDRAGEFENLPSVRKEESPEWRAYADRRAREIVGFLSANVKTCVIWKELDTRGAFRQSLLEDLGTPTSPLRKRLKLSPGDSERLRGKLSRVPLQRWSRQVLAREVSELPRTSRGAFLRYVDSLYYLSGANAVNSLPVVRAADVSTYRQKLSAAASKQELEPDDSRLIQCFGQVLKELNIDTSVMSRLSDRDVVVLRKELPTGRLQRTYFQLIRKAAEASRLEGVDTSQLETEQAAFQRMLKQYVREEISTQRERLRRTTDTFRYLSLAGYAAGVASLVVPGGPGLALLSAAGLEQLADPLFRFLIRQRSGDLIVFAERVRSRAQGASN